MRIHLATDHSGFAIKESIVSHLQEQGYEIVDHGAFTLQHDDDYVDFVRLAAQAVSNNPQDKAIILGGSGQGEAIVANRFPHVRAAVYYGKAGTQTDSDGNNLDMIASTRRHNDANVLSLGVRFLDEQHIHEVIERWLDAPFEGAERHLRRINKIDQQEKS